MKPTEVYFFRTIDTIFQKTKMKMKKRDRNSGG